MKGTCLNAVYILFLVLYLTLCLPKSQRKDSTISIDDFVEDAARQFDQLTDGSDFSGNEESDDEQKR